MLCGPEETEHNLYTDTCKPPPGAVTKAVRVNPGTVLVQAHATEDEQTGKIINPSPNSWYVLNDDPVLQGSDITNPAQSNDETTGQPNVTFGFTSHGKGVFEGVTKEIAHRGQEAQLPGVSKEAALQHFAVVLDGQLITVPSIDFTKSTRKGSTPPPALRSPAASPSPPPRTSPTSSSRARCRSSSC